MRDKVLKTHWQTQKMRYLIILNFQLFEIIRFFNQFIIVFNQNNFNCNIILEVCIC
jgi:hypothetical protein